MQNPKMSNNPNTIKSPRPRWFNGILYIRNPDQAKPDPDFAYTRVGWHSQSYPQCSNSSSPNPDYDSGKIHADSFLNMSPFSDISADKEPEHDVQSIQFDDDIFYLQDVKLCDTAMFTPNIQYGKVVHILSGSELLIAARIYNGYTKVIGPRLYCFQVRMRDVPNFGVYEDTAKEELKRLILDKIVLLTNTSMVTDGFIDAKVYLLHMNHLKHYLKYGSLHTINFVHGDGNVYVNETINNYIRLKS